VYSDLIKVRICADSGKVLGMEAMTYYTNHTTRTLDTPILSQEQASKKVSENIKIETARLSIVPIGNSLERLAYEFSGESNGQTFYVYIDAETGTQLQMFKVIESTEGTLLM
jgi:germination protein YpeB